MNELDQRIMESDQAMEIQIWHKRQLKAWIAFDWSIEIGYGKELWVHADDRRTGLATMLMNQMEEMLKQKGIQTISLFPHPFTPFFEPISVIRYKEARSQLIVFYEKLGYQMVQDRWVKTIA